MLTARSLTWPSICTSEDTPFWYSLHSTPRRLQPVQRSTKVSLSMRLTTIR